MAQPKLQVANEIKIDKGVPMQRGWGGSGSKYPWFSMEVGDSFFSPLPMASMSRMTSVRKKVDGRKYSTRTVTESGVKGTRVWRTA